MSDHDVTYLQAAVLRLEAERDAALAERDAWKAASDTRSAEVATWMRDAQGTQTALTEARRVLREVEWNADRCPVCRWAIRFNDEDFDGVCLGHAPDCALVAVLVQEEK